MNKILAGPSNISTDDRTQNVLLQRQKLEINIPTLIYHSLQEKALEYENNFVRKKTQLSKILHGTQRHHQQQFDYTRYFSELAI
jgi:hypothetical protein